MNELPDPNRFTTNPKEAVGFLQWHRPGGPHALTAIKPDGPVVTDTARTDAAVDNFVERFNHDRNIYYSVNPTSKAMTSKAAKTDIAAIEFGLADCDPEPGETSAAAKERYQLAIKTQGLPHPSAIIDSGNGLQLLWRLDKPIKLPDPILKDGKPCLSPEAESLIADVEDRIKAVMLKLGTKAGTQNIDRILRVPGTTNFPNAKKLNEGRVKCRATLIESNDSVHALESFPLPEKEAKVSAARVSPAATPAPKVVASAKGAFEIEKLRVSDRILAIIRTGKNPGARDPDDRSAAVFAVCLALAAKGYGDDAFEAIFLDPKYPISDHVGEQKNPAEYLAKQIANARGQTTKERTPDEPPILDPKNPMGTARSVLAAVFSNANGASTLVRYHGSFLNHDGARYREMNDEKIESVIWNYLEKAVKRAKEGFVPFTPTGAIVRDAQAALKAITQLDDHIDAPAWLGSSADRLPASEFLACANGLLHLPTGELHTPTPEFFNLYASDVTFDPLAPEPTGFLAFHAELFGDDHEAIELLQEWFGYSLSSETSQQKIMLMLGPKRSGKGTIARVLTGLLGPKSVAGPTMSSLGETFGLEVLLTASQAIISDARIGKKTDTSAVVERLLSISGEDRISVPRKNKLAWTTQLRTRFMILTNEEPSLMDSSGALASRFLLLKLTKSFIGIEDKELSNKLMRELSGILNWAMVGYRRLNERGRFVQPESGAESLDTIGMMAAPALAFIDDRCELGFGFEVSKDDMFEAWQRWALKQNHHVGNTVWLTRNLQSAGLGINTTRPLKDGKQIPYYSGIRLKTPSSSVRQVVDADELDDAMPF
jgi:P4 family phage/plasmid primase-like protien